MHVFSGDNAIDPSVQTCVHFLFFNLFADNKHLRFSTSFHARKTCTNTV